MIGFFDSGIGGLTISEAVRKQLPEYDILYLGDAAHAPYGEKSHDELVNLTWQGVEWLFRQGCRSVIIACNSASASALREIQQTKLADWPGYRVLGIVRPTVEHLAEAHYKNILILSTEATKESGAYQAELKKLDPSIAVTSLACPAWAPMIEQGLAGTQEMKDEVRSTLEGVSAEHDAVLLACTHYPYVTLDVEVMMKSDIPVFNQGEFVAQSLIDYLQRHPEIEEMLEKYGSSRYLTTGDAQKAQEITQAFGFDVEFNHLDI